MTKASSSDDPPRDRKSESRDRESRDAGDADAGTHTADGGISRAPVERLGGDEDGSAAERIPRIEFVPDLDSYDERGFATDTLLIAFETEASVAQVNQLLEAEDGVIVGGYPGVEGEAAGLMAWRVPTEDREALNDVVQRLREESVVAHAAEDVLLSKELLPNDDDAAVSWNWHGSRVDGNWGLKLVGVPGMWNWNESIRELEGEPVPVGVIDGGFYEHPDLDLSWSGRGSSHGTHVAGIIGARFDNGLGIDGVNPFVKFELASGKSEAHHTFTVIPRWQKSVKVINISMGIAWDKLKKKFDISTELPEERDWANELGALTYGLLNILQLHNGSLPQIVVSAGNDDSAARYDSGLANASIQWGAKNVIVVENVTRDSMHAGGATREEVSNRGGTISAPGTEVLSTVKDGKYEKMTGTSMAAPLISGVVSYLYALEPDLPMPTLDDNPALDALIDNSVPVGGNASNRVDAFRTALDVDSIMGSTRLLRALVDVDDGTVDGNRRVHPIKGSVDEDRDHDENGRLGDGEVDMADFRTWRDAALFGAVVGVLDGLPDHPKFDLNLDGEMGSAAEETHFSRFDFNGDNLLSVSNEVTLRGAVGDDATDLEVLSVLFQDDIYSASELSGLVESADVTVDLEDCFLNAEVSEVAIAVTQSGDAAPFKEVRRQPGDASTLVLTVPVGGWDVTVEAFDEDGERVSLFDEAYALDDPGMDIGVRPVCNAPDTVLLFERIDPTAGYPGEAVRLFLTEVSDPELLETAIVRFAADDDEALVLDATVVSTRALEDEDTLSGWRGEVDVVVPALSRVREWVVSVEFRDERDEPVYPESNDPVFNLRREIVGRWNMNIAYEAYAENCDNPNPSYDWYFWSDGTWTDIGIDAQLDANTWGTGSATITDGTWELEGDTLTAEGCANDLGTSYEFRGTYDSETQSLVGEYTVLQEGKEPFVQPFCSQSYSRPIDGCLDTQCHADRIPFSRGSCIGDTCVSGQQLVCLAASGQPQCGSDAESLDLEQGCNLGDRCGSGARACCECVDDPDLSRDGVWHCADPSGNAEGCPGLPVPPGTPCSDTDPEECAYCSPEGDARVQRCAGGEWIDR